MNDLFIKFLFNLIGPKKPNPKQKKKFIIGGIFFTCTIVTIMEQPDVIWTCFLEPYILILGYMMGNVFYEFYYMDHNLSILDQKWIGLKIIFKSALLLLLYAAFEHFIKII